jgi:hypothetical protein
MKGDFRESSHMVKLEDHKVRHLAGSHTRKEKTPAAAGAKQPSDEGLSADDHLFSIHTLPKSGQKLHKSLFGWNFCEA